MKPANILLLFGGESSEHDVSIASAKNVYSAIDTDKYHVTLCYIDRSGKWGHAQSIEDAVNGKKLPKLAPVPGEAMLVAWPTGTIIRPDVILPVLHGSNGEDGSIQGLAQLMHVPIVGPGIVGSAVCMDKEVAKRLLKGVNIPIVDWITYKKGDTRPAYTEIVEKLGSPVFVKPAAQGSSVGVSKASDEQGFDQAIESALTYDDKVLIEKAVSGRELEVAVMGNNKPQATKAGEIVLGDDFYSYDEKYSGDSSAKVMVPADVSEDLHERLRSLAIDVYRSLECRGLARVDFFACENGDIYVNEVNTLPGFTDISMYPKLWEAEGLSSTDLVDKLIEFALEK